MARVTLTLDSRQASARLLAADATRVSRPSAWKRYEHQLERVGGRAEVAAER